MGLGERRCGRPAADKLIVGLGNPGPQYIGTRHNVGFAVVETLARELGAPRPRQEAASLITEAALGSVRLVLAQPLTYMNRSGSAVRLLLDKLALNPREMLVIFDDVYLPVGTLRLRPRGSAGGHNGVKSLIAALGTEDFPRLRVGIGFPQGGAAALAEYVLSPFSAAEGPVINKAVEAAAAAAKVWAREGIERAMSLYNGWRAESGGV